MRAAVRGAPRAHGAAVPACRSRRTASLRARRVARVARAGAQAGREGDAGAGESGWEDWGEAPKEKRERKRGARDADDDLPAFLKDSESLGADMPSMANFASDMYPAGYYTDQDAGHGADESASAWSPTQFADDDDPWGEGDPATPGVIRAGTEEAAAGSDDWSWLGGDAGDANAAWAGEGDAVPMQDDAVPMQDDAVPMQDDAGLPEWDEAIADEVFGAGAWGPVAGGEPNPNDDQDRGDWFEDALDMFSRDDVENLHPVAAVREVLRATWEDSLATARRVLEVHGDDVTLDDRVIIVEHLTATFRHESGPPRREPRHSAGDLISTCSQLVLDAVADSEVELPHLHRLLTAADDFRHPTEKSPARARLSAAAEAALLSAAEAKMVAQCASDGAEGAAACTGPLARIASLVADGARASPGIADVLTAATEHAAALPQADALRLFAVLPSFAGSHGSATFDAATAAADALGATLTFADATPRAAADALQAYEHFGMPPPRAALGTLEALVRDLTANKTVATGATSLLLNRIVVLDLAEEFEDASLVEAALKHCVRAAYTLPTSGLIDLLDAAVLVEAEEDVQVEVARELCAALTTPRTTALAEVNRALAALLDSDVSLSTDDRTQIMRAMAYHAQRASLGHACDALEALASTQWEETHWSLVEALVVRVLDSSRGHSGLAPADSHVLRAIVALPQTPFGPPPLTLDALVDAACDALPDATTKEVLQLLDALAQLRAYRLEGPTLNRLAHACLLNRSGMDPEQAVDVLDLLARAGVKLRGDAAASVEALFDSVVAERKELPPQDVAVALYASAALGIREKPERTAAMLDVVVAAARMGRVEYSSAATCLRAIAKLKHAAAPRTLDGLLSFLGAEVPHMTPEGTATCLFALGVAAPALGPQLLTRLVKRFASQRKQMDAKELSNALWALGRLNAPTEMDSLDDILDEVDLRVDAGSMNCRDLSDCASAIAALSRRRPLRRGLFRKLLSKLARALEDGDRVNGGELIRAMTAALLLEHELQGRGRPRFWPIAFEACSVVRLSARDMAQLHVIAEALADKEQYHLLDHLAANVQASARRAYKSPAGEKLREMSDQLLGSRDEDR